MDSLTLDHIRKCYGPNTILDNLTYSFPLKEVSSDPRKERLRENHPAASHHGP